ncbi:type IV secretory system conjugative DNA transfer family protein [Halobellus rubicundus]|uniref:Type IV secretory system conjugative DNA transfer family protein n=1 Tax=Halobellus rubicundus TaxID=2996466 RepID=A0ABD5M831_9EURY
MTPEEAQNLIENSDAFTTTFIGTRTSKLGVEEDVGIPDDQRRLHVLTTGPTGYGKTQVMIHAALQDSYKNRGFCFLIPKGGAEKQILSKLPEDRLDDVLYINPGESPLPSINVLQPHTTEEMTRQQKENQKEIIVSDLIDLFKRQSENWGDQFGRVLETLLRAHLNQNIYHGQNKSLLDVFHCVTQDEELSDLIDQTEDPVIRRQLVQVKEDLSSYEMGPLQRRLNDFVMRPTIRKIISSQHSDINFRKAVNQGKIILVDIQKGEIGETVSTLVGSIIITQVWAAAQSRITQTPENREPFYLYVDELQNFGSEGSALAQMLAEAREYRLGLWLATQYISNLDSKTMQEAVLNNCRSKILFQPSDSENKNRLISTLNQISKNEINQLGRYRAILQTPSRKTQKPAVKIDTYPPWTGDRDNIDDLEDRCSVASENPEQETRLKQSLGKGNNAGKEKHRELLAQAKKQLEQKRDGIQVQLLHQGAGEDKPDGKVILPDDTVAHLEAEHSTLSKPAKVLTNYLRAAQQGRETIFVVEQGNAVKLQNIVEEPVNRRGNDHEDQDADGSYSYYTNQDGEEFTQIDELQNSEYRIIEIHEDQLEIHNSPVEPECPELDHNDREDLENFCLYREEDGHCTALNQKCVLTE